MPKSPRQKQKLLYLARYFWEHTDEQHTVTTPQLIAYLNANDIKAERKSIYDDVETLIDFGFDIVKEQKADIGNGFFMDDYVMCLMV